MSKPIQPHEFNEEHTDSNSVKHDNENDKEGNDEEEEEFEFDDALLDELEVEKTK